MTDQFPSYARIWNDCLQWTKELCKCLLSDSHSAASKIDFSVPQIVHFLAGQFDALSGGFMGGKGITLNQFFPSKPLFNFIFDRKHFLLKWETVSKKPEISSQRALNRQPLGLDLLVGGCLLGESVPLIFTFPSRFQQDPHLSNVRKYGGILQTQ